jgi:tRNA threonylcarbamoyladenosine biosynthesis protein TsaB
MELTIDTASALASVALAGQGALIAELTWTSDRGHAADLLPAVERLLAAVGRERSEIRAVFVNRGPGGYAGLRVGISTALALAFALDAEVLGFGRLEADAYPYLPLGRPVCAIHDAGRGEFAWAVYQALDGEARELSPPRIGRPDEVAVTVPAGSVVTGELRRFNGPLPDGVSLVTGTAGQRHAATGAELAWRRFAGGARHSRLALTPLYLREPNITAPRQPRNAARPV